MRYIIYGAGAVGGSIGARLFMTGEKVLLIARGEHLSAIREKGLRYRNPETTRTLRIPSAGHPRDVGFRDDDVVLLTMKSQHTEAALVELEGVAPSGLPIICCQNGVANEFAAARRFRNVYAMVVQLPAAHITAGEVLHYVSGVWGILDAGCFPSGTDDVIKTVCAALTKAGFGSVADPQPLRWKYAKLLPNLGNALQAICEAGWDEGDIINLLREEALTCYAAAGIDVATDDETRERLAGIVMGTIDGADRGGGSSWQSISRATGDIEADFLNGEICLLGKLHGVPTPANEVVRTLANKVARLKLRPGTYSLSEVADEIKRLMD